MSFKLGDIVVDRIQYGMATDFNENPLYVLTQLADASIETSAESKDAVDARGNLIKKFWQAKNGTFTATNAMLNLNILAANSGSAANIASVSNPIEMPRIVSVKAGTTLTLRDAIEGTVTVNALANNGSMGKAYTKGTTASATEFAVSGNTLTPPTDTEETQYIVKYKRNSRNGVQIVNKAEKFPDTIKLYLKVLCVDPCEADTLRSATIVLHSFQPSPETTINLTTDGQLDYTGDLQVAYCVEDNPLYSIYFDPDDEEDI